MGMPKLWNYILLEMYEMKWSEFKKQVKEELKGKDPDIDYIDMTGDNASRGLEIGIDRFGELFIYT